MTLRRNSTTKMTKVTCAMEVAIPATPENHSTPAINATTRNVRVQLNMVHLLNGV